jgi:hypothetical protein
MVLCCKLNGLLGYIVSWAGGGSGDRMFLSFFRLLANFVRYICMAKGWCLFLFRLLVHFA